MRETGDKPLLGWVLLPDPYRLLNSADSVGNSGFFGGPALAVGLMGLRLRAAA